MLLCAVIWKIRCSRPLTPVSTSWRNSRRGQVFRRRWEPRATGAEIEQPCVSNPDIKWDTRTRGWNFTRDAGLWVIVSLINWLRRGMATENALAPSRAAQNPALANARNSAQQALDVSVWGERTNLDVDKTRVTRSSRNVRIKQWSSLRHW